MTDVLKMGRKALTVGVAVTTIAWSMMAAVLVAPMQVSAAGCTSGTLIKGSLSAVYYCGGDQKRYVFPNEKTYMSWYSDFSGVTKISDSDLASLQIGGNVTYRPGVKMVKITTDPKVYAVSKDGVLRPIADEATAVALYGSTWNKQIDDVSDAFFTNYSVGSAVSSVADFDKAAEMSGAQTINGDKNLGSGSASTGTIAVAVAADAPTSLTLPKGAMGVNFLKFTLKNNGASDAVVTNATLKRVGPGATTDLSAVYLYEGAARLTTGRTVNSSTNEVNFTGVNLTIKAGETRTLWAAADILCTGVNCATSSAGASNVHRLELVAVQAGSATVGGLPVVGPNMTISGATVGSLTIGKTGSITNPKVGQANAKVAEFTVAAGSSEDVWFQRLTLFQGGNLSAANLTNLKLKQSSNVVATASSLDAKLHAVFNLASPMLIEKGATKSFEVWADIGGAARTDDSIKLYAEEAADVYGIGATYGQGVAVTRTTYDGDSCTSSSGDCSYSEVKGGQVTITFNGPSSQNLASNGKDRELFNFTMAAQGNVEVKRVTLAVACGPAVAAASGCKDSLATADGNANYTDIKIIDVATGQVWWGPADLASLAAYSDSSQSVVFTDVQTLAAGTAKTFKVTADVRSTVPSNDTVKITLTAFGTSDLRNLDNNTFIAPSTDVVPSGDITGNQHTVLAPSLVISRASAPVSGSYVKGSTAAPTIGINLKAGDGADIKVTSMTLKGAINAAGTASAMTVGYDSPVAVSDVIMGCKLMDGSTQVGETKSPTSSAVAGSGGELQFTSLNLTVPASSTKTLLLTCDVSNSAYRNSNGEVVGFSLASGDITAQDPDGSTLTSSLSGSVNALPTSGTIVTPIYITITEAGTITVQLAPDDTETEAGLVVAGNQSAVLGKWRFTAANEELKLAKLAFFLDTLATNRSVSSLSLYDGSTLLAGPTALTTDSTSSSAVFSGMSLVIPKNAAKTVTLKAAVNSIAAGGTTGDNLKMRVFIPGTDGADTSSFEARGTSSSTVIRQLSGANTVTAGQNKLVRKSKPTVSLASLPTSIVTNGGGIVLSRFTVTADAAENISLKKVAFKVSMSGNLDEAVSLPAIREVGQGSDINTTTSGSSTVQVNGNYCGFAASNTNACVTVVFSNEQVISAGTSKTYELRMTVAGYGTAGESISTSLLGDSTDAVGELDSYQVGGYGIDAVVTGTDYDPTDATKTSNFLWSDNGALPHNDTIDTANGDNTASNDWMNGTYVKVLPADAQTMTRS